MSIRFVRFAAAHLSLFEWQAAQRAHVKFGDMQSALAIERDGIGWTGWDDAGVVGCAGFMPTDWGVACWAAFSDRLILHARPVVKFIRHRIALRAEKHIQALVAHDHPKAARFAQALGFELERSPALEGVSADLYRFKRGG